MTKVKGLFMVGTILLGVSLLMFLVMPAVAQRSTDAALVKIEPDVQNDKVVGFLVDPATLYVKKNTIVVWMSGVDDTEVQVVFQDGKTCRDVTANPNLKIPGFFLDSKSCYVTSFLPYSATTTLQFVELGNYTYEVVTADGKLKAKGAIIVAE